MAAGRDVADRCCSVRAAVRVLCVCACVLYVCAVRVLDWACAGLGVCRACSGRVLACAACVVLRGVCRTACAAGPVHPRPNPGTIMLALTPR